MLRLTSALLLGVCLASPVSAQRPIDEIPRALGSYLEEDDAELDGRHYEDYVFDGADGREIVAEMASDDLDAVLHLGRYVGGELEIFASNDDGFEQGTDSRIVATLPSTGEYVLRATSYGEGELGGYVLRLFEDGAEPSWDPPLVRAGDVIEGELTLADLVATEDIHVDEYLIDIPEGQRLVITLTSDDFDTYLSVLHRIGREIVIDESDDAPGLGTDSRIDFTFEVGGLYVIVASSYDPDTAGAYRLSVEAR